MGMFTSLKNPFRFRDTVIYKGDNDLQKQYDALIKLSNEYPKNEKIKNKLDIVKKGLDGENEIEYQLKKSHIGMYVLRDVKIKYEDLTAQIDYVIITPVFTYYVESKNLKGNIIINDKGDFTVEKYNNREGIPSPLRQVEAQREVLRKIWESKATKLTKLLAEKNFEYYRKVLVVITNKNTILNLDNAPKDIKDSIVRADALIRYIEDDIKNCPKDEYIFSQKEMEQEAQNYLNIIEKEDINYYEYFKREFCENEMKEVLKEIFIEFRKSRAKEMNIPAYYVFTNEELDKIIETKPTNLEELGKILPEIKVKTHGEKIIEIINK